MPSAVARILTAPIATKVAKYLERLQKQRDEWPYWWKFPAPDATRVHKEGVIVAPAAATQTIINQYQVPSGYKFALQFLTQIYIGSGFTPGSGDITWVLDINNTLAGAIQGFPVQGFQSTLVPYGGYQNGVFAPWMLAKPEIIGPLDVLRSKVTTTAAITPGAPNFFISIFDGLLYPASEG
jgi:hypothetical protein